MRVWMPWGKARSVKHAFLEGGGLSITMRMTAHWALYRNYKHVQDPKV
jgi:hypothetical protein